MDDGIEVKPVSGLVSTRLSDPVDQTMQQGLFALLNLRVVSPEDGCGGGEPEGNEKACVEANEDGKEDSEASDSENISDNEQVTVSPYMELSDHLAELLDAKRLVIRDCYKHLMPMVLDALDKGGTAMVAGTSGIGKSMFGLLLLRAIIMEKGKTAVFWNKDAATAISLSEEMKKKYGLDQTFTLQVGGETRNLYMATWAPDTRALINFLVDKDVWLIHDPAVDYIAGGMRKDSKTTVFILSYGHALMDEWIRKGGMPKTAFYVPCFKRSEILANKINLFHDREDDWKQKMDENLEASFEMFGGSIRHYGRNTRSEFWETMVAKIRQVLNEKGADIGARTVKFRGSILHIQVRFDSSKPLFPDPDCNNFEKQGYFLGSDKIAQTFASEFEQRSVQDMKDTMRLFSGEPGVETVYGVLFETYVHRLFRESKDAAEAPEYKLKVVYHGDKNRVEFATTRLKMLEQVRFAGRDPMAVKESFGDRDKVEVGTYFQPDAGNFPTYDAVLIVPGKDVGMNCGKVALLLQMTVSGASGIPRQPKHTVKRQIRLGFEKVMKDIVEDFNKSGQCVTTFCVPTPCFQPFQFQPEEKIDGTQSIPQPKFQFVLEIPECGFIKLKQGNRRTNSMEGELHEPSGTHRFRLPPYSERPSKVQKVGDLHIQ